MIVQFHLQTPDIPLVAESETVILNYDIFIVDLTLLRYKFEKIQDNNLPKIEKIQGKKLKRMLLMGLGMLQKTAQICGDSG